MSIEAIARALEAATLLGDPPAAACAVIVDGRLVHESAHGASDGPATPKSVFDVASVTKAFATTLAVARLVRAGELTLDAPVSRWLPAFAHPALTPRALLGHRSGLPAWRPFFVEAMRDPIAARAFTGEGDEEAFARSRARVVEALAAVPVTQPGLRVYSDLGFLILGLLVEAVGGARLDRHCLGFHAGRDLGFSPLPRDGAGWLAGRHVLPTGRTRPREPAPGQAHLYAVPPQTPRVDAGRVDDDNAFAMGGVAGHAGLFGTAGAIASLGMAVIDEADGGEALGIGAEVLGAFLTLDPAEGSPRGLGFDVPTGPASSAGPLGRGPRGAFGHLGFTGCSVWLDLDRRLSVALLTNRTLPGRHAVAGILALRPAVHGAIADAFPLRL